MKKTLPLFLAGILLSTSPSYADIEFSDAGSETISDVVPQAEDSGAPFWLEIHFDIIGKTDFNESFLDSDLRYEQAYAQIGSVVLYHAECDEGIALSGTFTVNRLRWEDNPFFDKDNFHTATLTLSAFTHRFCNWKWSAQFGANFDTDYSDVSHYTTYDMLLWGRYTYLQNVHLHVGFLATTGMKADRVYPIFGFDWCFCDRWLLSLVYPLNVSLSYKFNDCFAFAVGARSFYSRHRVGKHEPLSKGIWEYRNTGIEALIKYYECDIFKADLHVGYAFGGHIKMSNRHHKHSHRFDFEGSPYIGAGFEYHF